MRGHVQGGTNAGWRSPFIGRAMEWQCGCVVKIDHGNGQTDRVVKTNIGALRRCPDCGARRDG